MSTPRRIFGGRLRRSSCTSPQAGDVVSPTRGGIGGFTALFGGQVEVLKYGSAEDEMRTLDLPFEYKGHKKMSARMLEDTILEPTEDKRWWCCQEGWRADAEFAGKKKPPNLMPPTKEEAYHFLEPKEADVVGEVRVEILEAAGLPRFDTFSDTDAYAVVVCEGFAARTPTVDNMASPIWLPHMPRAFKFLVTRSYSKVYIGLLDGDQGNVVSQAVQSDDEIGRVVLDLHTLFPRTVYTSWFPLQRESLKKHVGKYGAVRLRYSVTWKADRTVLLDYWKGFPKFPKFLIPCKSHKDVTMIRFAVQGQTPDDVYDYNVLKHYINELNAAYEGLVAIALELKEILFWKYPTFNIVAGIAWQFLTNHPKYIIASCPLAVVTILNWSYPRSRCLAADPISRSPSFVDFMKALVLPQRLGALPKLSAVPVYRHMQAVERNYPYESEDEDEKELKIPGSDSNKVPVKVPESAEDEKQVAEAVAKAETEDVDADPDNRTTAQRLSMTINPVARILYPLQQFLAMVVQPIRLVKHTVAWEDPAFTTQLYLALCVLALILAIIPWRFVFMWTGRLLGVVIWGPHMYWVGKWLKDAEDKQRQLQLEEEEKARLAAEEAARQAEKKGTAGRILSGVTGVARSAASTGVAATTTVVGTGLSVGRTAASTAASGIKRLNFFASVSYKFKVDSSPFYVAKYQDTLDARRATAVPLPGPPEKPKVD